MRVSASGGTPQAVSQLDEQKHERTHRWPALLPGGKSALVTVGSLEHPDDYDEATIEAIRLDTGARQVVLKGGRMATYIATGHLVYLHGKVLYAAPFDAGRLQVTGAPVPLIDGVAGDTTTGAADYSVSTNGTIAYVPGDPTGGEHMLAWVDMKGAATMIDFPTSLYYDPKISQDGRRVTLSIIESASTRNIAVLDPHRGSSTKLTFRGMNRTPLWSPDGRSVYYISYDTASNASVLMRSASDGSGTPERLRELRGQAYLEDITSDGSAVVFSISAPGTGSGRGAITVGLRSVIARLSVANPASEPVIVVTGTADVFNAAVSPNGQWIAYASQETGRPEVLAQSFTSAGGRQPISTAGGTEPRWSPDGKTLYYVNGDQMMAVSLEPGPALLPGRPRTLFSGVVPISVDSAETYHLTPTGDRFLMMRSDTRTSAPAEVRAIFGWFPTIGR
jgi:serine/threonine-protein kinase